MTRKSDKNRSVNAALSNAGAFLANITVDDLRRSQVLVASYVVEQVPDVEREDALRYLLQLLGIDRLVGEHFTAGTIEGYRWHVDRGETPCQPCWRARIRELEEMWSRECPMILR